jgi:ATP-binding cassette subfamily F protein uup
VVSHDRYFVERVCDNVHALTAAGGIRHLAGGIDQYIEQRRAVEESQLTRSSQARSVPAGTRIRAARKETKRAERELTRLEGAIELLTQRETTLNEQMAVAATDHARLTKLQAELGLLVTERGALETSWLEASESLERCE